MNYLEHVQAVITLNATRRGAVQLFLRSPMGTRSVSPFSHSRVSFAFADIYRTHPFEDSTVGFILRWTIYNELRLFPFNLCLSQNWATYYPHELPLFLLSHKELHHSTTDLRKISPHCTVTALWRLICFKVRFYYDISLLWRLHLPDQITTHWRYLVNFRNNLFIKKLLK